MEVSRIYPAYNDDSNNNAEKSKCVAEIKTKSILEKDYTNWQTTALVNIAENEATVKSAFWWSKMLLQKLETMI